MKKRFMQRKQRRECSRCGEQKPLNKSGHCDKCHAWLTGSWAASGAARARGEK